jgi:hypothetical protein
MSGRPLKDGMDQPFRGAANPRIAALGYANVDYNVRRGMCPPPASLSYQGRGSMPRYPLQ